MTDIIANLASTQQRIDQAMQKHGREKGSVKLLAVSKTRPLEDIEIAIHAGQYDFGENYLQDALPKIEALDHARLQWHFIGPIQSNKTRRIAENFDWVHSIDRISIAQRLSQQRGGNRSPLMVCIQVNTSGEDSKSGVNPEQLSALAVQIHQLPQLNLRGLMTIPAPCTNFEQQRKPFQRLRVYLEQLQSLGLPVDTLSMGMSNDLEAAIAEGATIVRIGTAIFGQRNVRR